jgi:hypothetical protein
MRITYIRFTLIIQHKSRYKRTRTETICEENVFELAKAKEFTDILEGRGFDLTRSTCLPRNIFCIHHQFTKVNLPE